MDWRLESLLVLTFPRFLNRLVQFTLHDADFIYKLNRTVHLLEIRCLDLARCHREPCIGCAGL
jgi:hypothetical protein